MTWVEANHPLHLPRWNAKIQNFRANKWVLVVDDEPVSPSVEDYLIVVLWLDLPVSLHTWSHLRSFLFWNEYSCGVIGLMARFSALSIPDVFLLSKPRSILDFLYKIYHVSLWTSQTFSMNLYFLLLLNYFIYDINSCICWLFLSLFKSFFIKLLSILCGWLNSPSHRPSRLPPISTALISSCLFFLPFSWSFRWFLPIRTFPFERGTFLKRNLLIRRDQLITRLFEVWFLIVRLFLLRLRVITVTESLPWYRFSLLLSSLLRWLHSLLIRGNLLLLRFFDRALGCSFRLWGLTHSLVLNSRLLGFSAFGLFSFHFLVNFLVSILL